MSRNEYHISKLITALGVAGLMLGLFAPRVSAQPPFSNAQYTGRYACSSASDDNFFTAVIKYNPNGNGAYSAGTLVASLEPFDADVDITPPSGDFCFYTLDIPASSYTIGTDGSGFEELVWAPVTTPANPSGCPSSFEDQTAIALRNMLDTTGATIRAEFSSANLLGQDEPGHGLCLK